MDKNGLINRLMGHVHYLADEIGERNFTRPGTLDKTAAYIDTKFREAGYAPSSQEFTLRRTPLLTKWRSTMRFEERPFLFKNGMAHLPGTTDENIVVGAHYDTASGTPGADDNASGIAVLLETARALRGVLQYAPAKKGITFVAFANEEPPFSRTSAMGSAQFVLSAMQRGEKISFMLCLEMLGFYTDQADSQSYPAFLKFFYPDQGRFIAVVGNPQSRHYVKKIKRIFEQGATPVESLIAPAWVRGVDFSDHMNFWAKGIPAVMLTDTAFYRNPNYHRATDLPHTLDFEKMAEAATGVALSIQKLAEE
jgi:Zn-dependent M28 family amino/carboxypeptidase